MLEGLATVPPWRQPRRLTGFVAGIDLFIPLLDVGYALIWVPGLVLFLFGYPIIVSAWPLVVLLVTLLVYGGLEDLPGSARLRSDGPSGSTQPIRLRRLPARVPGAVFHGLPRRIWAKHLAGAHRRWK